jgi:hypothetical protein
MYMSSGTEELVTFHIGLHESAWTAGRFGHCLVKPTRRIDVIQICDVSIEEAAAHGAKEPSV